MYLTPYLQEKLEPGLVGFRSHENMWDLDARRINYVSTAAKFEFSTMAFGCALGLSESIDFIYKTGVETIFQHNKLLSDRLIEGMLEIGAKITSPLNDKDRTSIVRAHIKSVDTYQLKNGLQNAQVFVSTRGNSIRFSPHLYNTLDDIDKAINEIKKMAKK
jgi:selenocysteine lyase/cysteine desulfurase